MAYKLLLQILPKDIVDYHLVHYLMPEFDKKSFAKCMFIIEDGIWNFQKTGRWVCEDCKKPGVWNFWKRGQEDWCSESDIEVSTTSKMRRLQNCFIDVCLDYHQCDSQKRMLCNDCTWSRHWQSLDGLHGCDFCGHEQDECNICNQIKSLLIQHANK